jgi:hypothetical protein
MIPFHLLSCKWLKKTDLKREKNTNQCSHYMHYYIPPYYFNMYLKKSMFLGFGLSGHSQFLPPAYEVKREPAILAQLPQVKAFAHAQSVTWPSAHAHSVTWPSAHAHSVTWPSAHAHPVT